MTNLDRTADGVDRECVACFRPFKGEAFHDYCAYCAGQNEKASPLRSRWACLTCSTTFELGRVISGPQGWQCPNCKSTDLSSADGSRDIPEYHGEIGTKN